jgi:hypothetical protein
MSMLRTAMHRSNGGRWGGRRAAASFQEWLTSSSTSSSTTTSSSSSALLPLRPHFVAGLATASRPVYAKRMKNDGGNQSGREVSDLESTENQDDAEGVQDENDDDMRSLEKQVTKELSRIGMADLKDEVLKQGKGEEEAVSESADPFDTVLREIADLHAKGLLGDHDTLTKYERYLHKKKSHQGLVRDINASLAAMSPDQQSFLSHFVEFVKPVDVEAEAAAKAAAAALAAKQSEEAIREKEAIAFAFAPGDATKLTVGKSLLRFSAQDQKQYLPEGVAGQLKNTQFKFGDESVVFRRAAYDLIQELKRRQESGFLASAGNDSLILNGEGGSGKSTILSQAVLWARKNDWFVVWIPDGRAWTGGERIVPSTLEHAHYDQIEKAARFAARLNVTHGDKLKAIKLKGDYEIEDFHRKSDSTLFDLLEFAYKHDKRAVNAVYYFRRELNRITEFPTLIAIDRYNYFWDNTRYFDPADVNRGNYRHLDAQKLMLTKMFSDHQDHGLVNGTMVCALETTKPATIKPFLRRCGDKHMHEIPAYSLNEFHEVMKHYKEIEYVNIDDTTKATERFIYQLCNGMPGLVFKYCGLQ